MIDGRLSQGERGRTLIARALINNPRLLLMDEPSTGLDVAAREQLLETLDQVHVSHPHLASILVTHHLEELPATTTHAALLREARLLAVGDADDVFTTHLVSAAFNHPIHITIRRPLDRSGRSALHQMIRLRQTGVSSRPEGGQMTKRRWKDLNQRDRRLIVFAGVLDGILKTAALADIRHRPADQIRGSKRAWVTALALMNSLGAVPVAYFVFGRRTPSRH